MLAHLALDDATLAQNMEHHHNHNQQHQHGYHAANTQQHGLRRRRGLLLHRNLIHHIGCGFRPIRSAFHQRFLRSIGKRIDRRLLLQPFVGIRRNGNHEIAIVRSDRQQNRIRFRIKRFQQRARPFCRFFFGVETCQVQQMHGDARFLLCRADGIRDLGDV